MTTIQDVEAVALQVQKACKSLYGQTQGHCREAAITLAEQLLVTKMVERVCVCEGTYGDYGHYWVTVVIDNVSWLIDPTIDQFDPHASLARIENSGELHHACFWLLFTNRLLALKEQLNLTVYRQSSASLA